MSFKNQCLFCKKKIEPIINFGKLPPSDYFAPNSFLAKNAKCYKLEVGRCKNCSLVQNINIISAKRRYQDILYIYNSANSNFAKKHWSDYTKVLSEYFKPNIKVLDIGCNDGYLLNLIKNKTKSKFIYGIDASPFQIKLSRKKYKNINFKCGYGENLKKIYNKNYFDLITCNNVLNHSSNPLSFLKEVNYVLKKDGKLIIEVPNWINTVKDKSWDQIYHEHVTYFTPFTISKILLAAGLNPFKIKETKYHGGSLRVFVDKKKLKLLINQKDVSYIQSKSLFVHAEIRKKSAKKIIDKLKNKNIYLFGAPAKGNTLVNYFGLNNKQIIAALETSKNKIGKFFPKACIPIINEDKIFSKNSYLINLNWNIPFVFNKFCKLKKLKKLII